MVSVRWFDKTTEAGALIGCYVRCSLIAPLGYSDCGYCHCVEGALEILVAIVAGTDRVYFDQDRFAQIVSGRFRNPRKIKTDPAGEWRDDNKEFQSMCTELGVTMVYCSPDDKRNASHAEHDRPWTETDAKYALTASAVLNYEYYRSEYWDFRDITWKSCMGHRGARAVRAEYKYTKIPL